jgi:hypothetical protein
MKKIFAIMVVAMATVFSCVTSNAQEVKKESPWVEVQQVDIPAGQTIYEGVTKSGNPKYWMEFDSIGKITVSPGSAVKYKEDIVTLVLVKWQHKENGSYKYSIRQKKGATKVTPNIDVTTLF